MCLKVAGPALTDGLVGWAVRPGSVRLGDKGYPANLLEIGTAIAGQRSLVVRIGNARLRVTADPSVLLHPGPCRGWIDPAAVQVWPVGTPGVDLGQGLATSQREDVL